MLQIWSITKKRQVLRRKLILLVGVGFLLLLFFSQIIKFELLTQNAENWLSGSFAPKKLIDVEVEENTNFLFGLINGNYWWIQSLMISLQIFTIGVLSGLFFYSQNLFLKLFVCFILIGALGNSINRFWNDGKVVDYIKVNWEKNYVNFNMEDILIFLGASGFFIICLDNIVNKKKQW